MESRGSRGNTRGVLAVAASLALVGTALVACSGGEPARPSTAGPWLPRTPNPDMTYYGAPNPTNLPPGGITEQMAIDIGNRCGVDDARAYAEYDEDLGRWVWSVSGGTALLGPTSACYCHVVLDFHTGETLDQSCTYALRPCRARG
jgi:hypothetical protein